jgi:hypothetical protein
MALSTVGVLTNVIPNDPAGEMEPTGSADHHLFRWMLADRSQATQDRKTSTDPGAFPFAFR